MTLLLWEPPVASLAEAAALAPDCEILGLVSASRMSSQFSALWQLRVSLLAQSSPLPQPEHFY